MYTPNPSDPILDDYEVGDPIRVCIECGEPLEWDYPYEVCPECEKTASCLHGTPYTEVCGKCCSESDFNYDVWRERR